MQKALVLANFCWCDVWACFLEQFTCQICSMFDKERLVLVSDCTPTSSSLFSTCLLIVGGWFIYYFYTICVRFGQLSSYNLEYFHFHYFFVHSSRVFFYHFYMIWVMFCQLYSYTFKHFIYFYSYGYFSAILFFIFYLS